MKRSKVAFRRWKDQLRPEHLTLLYRILQLDAIDPDGDPFNLLSIGFHAGWMAARQQYKMHRRKHKH